MIWPLNSSMISTETHNRNQETENRGLQIFQGIYIYIYFRGHCGKGRQLSERVRGGV